MNNITMFCLEHMKFVNCISRNNLSLLLECGHGLCLMMFTFQIHILHAPSGLLCDFNSVKLVQVGNALYAVDNGGLWFDPLIKMNAFCGLLSSPSFTYQVIKPACYVGLCYQTQRVYHQSLSVSINDVKSWGVPPPQAWCSSNMPPCCLCH